MTLNDAIVIAEAHKKAKQTNEIIGLLSPFWVDRKTVDLACLLAYAYRRNGDFEKCKKICDEADTYLNKPSRISIQRKWCYVFELIVPKNAIDANEYALEFIKKIDKNSGYDFTLLKFVCQVMSRKFEDHDLKQSVIWLTKIDGHKLNSRIRYEATEGYEEATSVPTAKYSSEKLVHYYKLSKIILSLNGWEEQLKDMMFNYEKLAKDSFLILIKKALHDFTDNDSKRIRYIASFLMLILEEDFMMKQSVYNNDRNLLISDISSFTYCPVSFAIKKSILKLPFSLDYDDQITLSRKYLNDYYEKFQNKKIDFQTLFEGEKDASFAFKDTDVRIISRIFTATRIGQNVRLGGNHLNYVFRNINISGSPDMYLKDKEIYIVEEVYTSRNVSKIEVPFETDKMKLAGYIYEMNIDFAYLFYWNTTYAYDDFTYKKIAKISGLKIFKIEKSSDLYKDYISVKDKVINFINLKFFKIASIPFNRCIPCSVNEYCVHKRKFYKEIKFPYKLNY